MRLSSIGGTTRNHRTGRSIRRERAAACSAVKAAASRCREPSVRASLDGLRSLPHLAAMIDTSLRRRFAPAPPQARTQNRRVPVSIALSEVHLRHPRTDESSANEGGVASAAGPKAGPRRRGAWDRAGAACTMTRRSRPAHCGSERRQSRPTRTRSGRPRSGFALTAEHAAARSRPIDRIDQSQRHCALAGPVRCPIRQVSVTANLL